eukprot:2020562-Pyramimonas_sp.AAC.1
MAEKEDQPQKGKARLAWPFPPSTPADALEEVQQIREALVVPGSNGLGRARSWAWKQAGEATIQ